MTKKDYCEKCYQIISKENNKKEKEKEKEEKDKLDDDDEDEFWKFDNLNADPAIHNWFVCDICKCSPLLGVRFSCTQCDFDVCEHCFNELDDNKHDHPSHKFDAHELPTPGNGYSYFNKRFNSSFFLVLIFFYFINCIYFFLLK